MFRCSRGITRGSSSCSGSSSSSSTSAPRLQQQPGHSAAAAPPPLCCCGRSAASSGTARLALRQEQPKQHVDATDIRCLSAAPQQQGSSSIPQRHDPQQQPQLVAAAAAVPGGEAAADAQQANEQQQQQQEQPPDSTTTTPSKQGFNYHSPMELDEQPAPVQLPPPGASPVPSQARPFFGRSWYRPARFLQHFAAPPGTAYNYVSFLGALDPAGGKYVVEGPELEGFLGSYFTTLAAAGKRVYLAEAYQDQPFKFFQELDFPWDLDPALVAALIPRVTAIVAHEVAAAYASQLQPGGGAPEPLLSMRTIYKVHLNFPGIFTVEAKAMAVRKAIINACRGQLSGLPPLALTRLELVVREHQEAAQAALQQLDEVARKLQDAGGQVPPQAQALLAELQPAREPSTSAQPPPPPPQPPQQPPAAADGLAGSSGPTPDQQQQQLDWESIIDFPHGSLRLLGSCKAPWMDKDPEWVLEKAYSPVAFQQGEEGKGRGGAGVWMRQPLTQEAVVAASILLRDEELRAFETSDEFLDGVYRTVGQHEQVLAAKRLLRNAIKQTAKLQQLLDDPAQAAAALQQQRPLSAEEAQARAQAKAERKRQQQEALAAEAEQQRKRAEALARMQAAAANAASKAATRRAEAVRPKRPSWPAPSPEPPQQP